MNQEKIGKFIKDIRIKNNLTQKQFADIFGVTFQAVSKWENGKNIPDIAILKQICEKYNYNINELLDGEVKEKSKSLRKYYFLSVFFIILFVMFIIISKNNDFEFKTLSSKSSEFDLYGSIAYNNDKASIYISNIDYCGSEENLMYNSVNCYLYENNGKNKKIIDECTYNYLEDKPLEEILKEVSFNIDDYQKTCKIYDDNLILEMVCTNGEGEEIYYSIPLKCA